jgi:putative transposase
MEYFKTESEPSFSEQVVLDLLLSTGDSDQDPLDYLMDEFRGSLKVFLENVLRAECDLMLGFAPYERGIGRPDMRNGYYERDLETVFGLLEDLRIPRTRKGTFETKLFAKYQRRQKQVASLIREMFVRGVSTRRIGEVLTPLLGIEPSAATVSRIAKSLDAEVAKYRKKQLSDDFIYLFLDGVTMKVKEAPKAVKKLVLCAYGVTAEGRRELIAFSLAKSESESCWEAFLKDLSDRGLEGKNLKLICTDGGAGMIRAADLVYYGVPRQRCWAHKGRNVAGKLRRTNQEECLSGMKRIYCQKNRTAAIKVYREWEARWEAEEPEAVACLAKDLEELLTFYLMPEAHWKKVRTTNLIERIFREVRRRTRPMSSFANSASCARVIFAVFDGFNKRWEHRPFPDFTQKA